MRRAARPRRDSIRTEFGFFLQLLGACGFVFAQPVFEAYSSSPEALLSAGPAPVTLVAFALAWALVPPLALWAITAWTRVFGASVRRLVHAAVLGGLAGVFVAQALTQSQTWSRPAIWVIALGGAATGTWCWLRFVNARTFLRYLALAPALFVAAFLFTAPVVDILRGDTATGVDATVPTPVMFIVFDELPTASLLDGEGRIDSSAFPGFARLASISTWYRNATTVSSTTEKAVPAILTGRRPTSEPVAPVANQFPQNLFTVLGAGENSQVIEPVTQLCPEYLCAARSGGLRTLAPSAIDLWQRRFRRSAPTGSVMNESQANDRVGLFDAFIEGLRSGPGPRLDFMHTLLPHVPWRLLASGRTYDEGTDNAISPYNYAWVTGEAARVGRARHLLQLQYADRRLGELLDRMDVLGTLEQTLIVVTADHGVSFDATQPLRASTPENLVEIAWSPLFIKTPGQPGGRIDDRNAESIDILPTVADVLDVPLKDPVDGRTLLGPAPQSSAKHMLPIGQSTLPSDDEGRVAIDGARGFRQLLAMPAAGLGTDALAAVRSGPSRRSSGFRQATSLPDHPWQGGPSSMTRTHGIPRAGDRSRRWHAPRFGAPKQ